MSNGGKFRHSGWPDDTVERLVAAIECHDTLEQMAVDFGVAFTTIRKKLIELGLYQPKAWRRFTPQEDEIIRADYVANADLRATAEKLGRSYGDIRQRIHHHHRDLVNTVRSVRGTKAVKRYGAGLLLHGATADEAARNIKAKILAAKATARVAAIVSKRERADRLLSVMREQISAGKERNSAIFEARSGGAGLQEIADCLDITRERVRQICDETAFKMAVDIQINDASKTNDRDWLVVAGGKS